MSQIQNHKKRYKSRYKGRKVLSLRTRLILSGAITWPVGGRGEIELAHLRAAHS